MSTVSPGSVHLFERSKFPTHPLFQSKFNFLKETCLMPYKASMAACTFANYKCFPKYPITEQVPWFQKVMEKIAYECNLNPTYPHVTELYLPSFSSFSKTIRVPFTSYEFTIKIPQAWIKTAHMTHEEAINRYVLSFHRKEKFDGTNSMNAFFVLLADVFPEDTFDKEDTMLTCHAAQTKIMRAALREALLKADTKGIIQKEADKLIARWDGYVANDESFDLTKETRLFTTGVISEAVLGGCCESDELCETFHFLNECMFNKALSLSLPSEEQFQEACEVLREIVSQILEKDKENTLLLFNPPNGEKFTEAQKKAQILVVLFAGQKTTSFVLDHLLANLANNSWDQKLLFLDPSLIDDFVQRRFVEIPPVSGVSRALPEDMILSFDVSQTSNSKFMKKGEAIVPLIDSVARQVREKQIPDRENNKKTYHEISGFGEGVHHCLGMTLALEELHTLPGIILNRFVLVEQTEKFTYTPRVTNEADAFYVKVIHRTQ